MLGGDSEKYSMMGMNEKGKDGRLPIQVPDSKFVDELGDFFYARFDVPGNLVECETVCEDQDAQVRAIPVICELGVVKWFRG